MPDAAMPRIGFIGLGLMGRPMARNLHRAGAEAGTLAILAGGTGQDLARELPATALSRDLDRRLLDAGRGGLDHSALMQVIEGEVRAGMEPTGERTRAAPPGPERAR